MAEGRAPPSALSNLLQWYFPVEKCDAQDIIIVVTASHNLCASILRTSADAFRSILHGIVICRVNMSGIGRWPIELVNTVDNELIHEPTNKWERKTRALYLRLNLYELLRAERGHRDS